MVNMMVIVRQKNSFQESRWSGGKTIELYLYPEDGSYHDRRFSYRLSTATVENEQSHFTSLPGYRRILIPLDNPITIDNLTKTETVHLVPFESYRFSGSDDVMSYGACRDFNLMFNHQYQGYLSLMTDDREEVVLEKGSHFIYALREMRVVVLGNNYQLLPHQLLSLETDKERLSISVQVLDNEKDLKAKGILASLIKKEASH